MYGDVCLMNIHFSNVNFSSNSGPNSFASRLADEMVLQGQNIVSEKDAYDVMLVFIEPSSTPKPGTKIIHRLDGIWFKPEEEDELGGETGDIEDF